MTRRAAFRILMHMRIGSPHETSRSVRCAASLARDSKGRSIEAHTLRSWERQQLGVALGQRKLNELHVLSSVIS